MRSLALAYYFILRSALRSRADLRPLLTRCRHCRIFFLAHPRNRGRKDLGCPFGCANAHRRKSSAERSAAYYRTAAGKKKKAQLNAKRKRARDPERELQQQPAAEGESEEIRLDAVIVEHVRLVTSLIEGVAVSREDVIEMLERVVRQRRMFRGNRVDYVLRWLAEHPP